MTTDPVRQEYDHLADVYDRRWRDYIDRTLRPVVEALPLAGRERILDVACGTGELEKLLLNRWPELDVVGVDVSRRMLDQARAKFGDQVRWIQSTADALAFPDRTFDCVVCANSFHYFPHPQAALREMERVLRPGGTLVIVDWCDDYLMCKLCSLWLRWRDSAFHRTYSLRECRQLLGSTALRPQSAHRFRVGWLWGLMRITCHRA